jgi:outer membrane protein TolC
VRRGRQGIAGVIAAVVLAAAAGPAAAQAPGPEPGRGVPAPRPLTLVDALTTGLRDNQQLRIAGFEVAIARAQLAQARGLKAGTVTAQASYTRVPDTGPITIAFFSHGVLHTLVLPAPSPNLYDLRFVLQYPLYTGGRIESQIALAEANVRGAEAALERVKVQIIYDIRQAYYRLLLAQAGSDVADRTVALAAESLRVAKARVSAGAAARFDEVQAEVNLAAARQSQVRARTAIAQASHALAALLSLPLDTPLVLRDGFSTEPVTTPLDRLIARALEARPELAELRARQAAAQAAIALAESGAKPTVGLNGVVSYGNTGGLFAGTAAAGNWSITLAGTLNLYDGGITRERIKEAQLRLEQLKATEALQRQGIELEVRLAYLTLQSAREELAGADALVAQAREALRIATVRFEAGVGITLEVLSAQTNASQAESARAQALYAYSVALAALERAVGAPVQ